MIKATASAELETARLRRSCQELLPSYAVPDEIRLLPALPLLPSGKLDRRALTKSLLAPLETEAKPDHEHCST
jgi:acyl-CoA synthetase (AMP-forming)/AMP-acid ligase II